MRSILILLLIFISCTKNSQTDLDNYEEEAAIDIEGISYESFEIYLLEELDESRGYCVDVKGSKTNANPDNGLQAHTCYSYQGEISVDQKFDKTKIEESEFYMPFFEVCMEAESIEESATLQLKICNKNEKQKFSLNSNGTISLDGNTDLCLTVSENSREGGGGNPIHRIRDLSLKNCNNNLSYQQKWGLRKIQ